MSIYTAIQNIKEATASEFSDFSSVKIKDDTGIGEVTLYLPAGTAQSVADAINAAVKESAQ